jgi:hypothetical protein
MRFRLATLLGMTFAAPAFAAQTPRFAELVAQNPALTVRVRKLGLNVRHRQLLTRKAAIEAQIQSHTAYLDPGRHYEVEVSEGPERKLPAVVQHWVAARFGEAKVLRIEAAIHQNRAALLDLLGDAESAKQERRQASLTESMGRWRKNSLRRALRERAARLEQFDRRRAG